MYDDQYIAPILIDSISKQPVVGNEDDDDIFMAVDPTTGVTVSAGSRLMMSFMIEKDILVENLEHPWLLPYTYVK